MKVGIVDLSVDEEIKVEYSEACEKLVEEIQKKEFLPWQYALMIMEFAQAIDNSETSKMSLALAVDSLKSDND